MSKKNRLGLRKEKHAQLLERERKEKEKREKKKAKKEGKEPKKRAPASRLAAPPRRCVVVRRRKIPKGLVRGASRNPEKIAEARLIMKARAKEARKAPKKMDLGDGPTGTARRRTEQKKSSKAARQALVDERRQMDTAR